MSTESDLLKSIIKPNLDITEDAVLDKYLLSRGINPKFATKDQKVSHSKTTQFITWKNYHMNEAVDKKDTVTLDIPLLIRVLELAREDIKTDMDLHRVVEKLINIRKKGMLTMKDYNYIAKIHEEIMPHLSENHIAIAMGKMLDDEGSMIMNQLDDIDRCSKMIRDYVGKDYEKQMPAWVQSKVTLAADYINTVGTYLMSKNEEASHDPWKDKHFGPTKIVKQKYHVKTDTKSYNVKADNEEHAHKLVTKHAPGSKIVSIEHKGRIMEEVESIDEISTDGYYKAANKSRLDAAVKVASSMGADKQARTKLDARNRGLKRLSDRTSAEMKKANSGPQRQPVRKEPTEAERRGYGQGRYMGDSVEHDDEVVVEMDNRTPSSDRQEQRNNSPEVLAKKDKEQQERLRGISPERRKILRLPEPKESVTEAQSAAVRFQRALEAAKKKREEETARNAENAKRALTPKPVQEAACACEMSKSARIIKSIYKKKGMKEETYDHEKEDKSVSSYGKKPKMQTIKKEASFGEKVPAAAAVLKGGTTLTGQTRDTVEIDPTMRKRPGPDITSKNK